MLRIACLPLLMLAIAARAQTPDTLPRAVAPAPAPDPGATVAAGAPDAEFLPDDPETIYWDTENASFGWRRTAAVHAGRTGLEVSYRLASLGGDNELPAVLVWSDRREYDIGDTATVFVRNVGVVPGYVAVFRIDANGTGHMLFPVAPADDNYVSQGSTVALRGAGGGTFEVNSSTGTGLLYAIISRDPLDFREYKKHGAWRDSAIHVASSPGDATTERWPALYRETMDIAERMSDYDFSAHLVAYEVVDRAQPGGSPAGYTEPQSALVLTRGERPAFFPSPYPYVEPLNAWASRDRYGCTRAGQALLLSLTCDFTGSQAHYLQSAWCRASPAAAACQPAKRTTSAASTRGTSSAPPRWITEAFRTPPRPVVSGGGSAHRSVDGSAPGAQHGGATERRIPARPPTAPGGQAAHSARPSGGAPRSAPPAPPRVTPGPAAPPRAAPSAPKPVPHSAPARPPGAR
jgi:hypothetical protein